MRKQKNVSVFSRRLSGRLWRGVTLQLFLVAVLPFIVLVLVVAFGSLALHNEAMRSLVADRNLRAVQSAAASLSIEINHRGETLEIIARDLTGSRSADEILARVVPEMEIFDGGVAVVDADGNLGAAAGAEAVLSFLTSPGWTAGRRLVSMGNPGVASYLPVENVEGRHFVPVIVPTSDGSALVGLFSPLAMLSSGLSVVTNEAPATILVVDNKYQVLFRSGSLSPEEDNFTHPGIEGALAGASEIKYLDTTEGEHVITTSSIQPVGWALMIEESWEDIASPLLIATQNAPFIIIPVFALSLLAIWFGLRKIVQPMQALEGKAKDLANGDFSSIREPVGGVPEIGHLQETLIEMAARLQEAQNSLHSYIGAITDSVENERRNLARELHDDTLQSMIALGQFTQYAMHWNKDPKVEKSLDQVMGLTDRGVKNLRRLVQGLRPIYIEDLGLATALEMQATRQDLMPMITVHFQVEGEERRLKPEIEMALFRIAQEALSNVRRHSEAKNAWILLHFQPHEIVLEIHDDGKGFTLPPDPIQYARDGHYGLLGLHERSELIGAKLVIRSTSGEGTHILVRLPENIS